MWTTNDYGHLMRYDPEKDRLEMSPLVLPHNAEFQTGWHSVFYDVAASPDRECVYAVTWIANSRLMRIWPNDGDWPRVKTWGRRPKSATRPFGCTFSMTIAVA